ncbi:MAG: carbohydrate porin, partial [Rhodoferax sp.]|nr:carbohydrate porin [Rhodoferax sp.]
MKRKTRLALMMGCLQLGAVGAAEVDFSGYARLGTGTNSQGGQQVCFRLPGADKAWRLGNECSYLIQPTLKVKAGEYEGAQWGVQVTPRAFHEYGDANNDELNASFVEMYAYAAPVAELGGGKVWAGRRFYNGLNLNLTDQDVETNDGDGAGIEDIPLGAYGKLSVAFISNPRTAVNSNRVALPLRVTNIPTFENGEMSVYLTHYKTSASNAITTGPTRSETARKDEPDGHSLGLYQNFKGLVLGGDTLLGVRKDRSVAAYEGSPPDFATAPLNYENVRAFVQQTVPLSRWNTTLEGLAQWRDQTDINATTNAKSTWVGIGLRSDTRIKGPLRLLLELSNDRVTPQGGDVRSLTKFTVAGAISAGADAGSRPTIRV